ncbi:MAG: DUF3343 domain-containing protein [Clostridia bacterium]|nr:DUF3343 domain-containing protein [Clostridia bacterium]
MHVYFVFTSRARALRAERALVQRGFDAAAVPTPQQAGLPCELSVRCTTNVRAREAYGIIKAAGLADGIRACFIKNGNSFKKQECRLL